MYLLFRRGMTLRERDSLIVEITLYYPSIIFEYKTLSDGSLALRLQYGPDSYQWITICNADQWHCPRIPALERGIQQVIDYIESRKCHDNA